MSSTALFALSFISSCSCVPSVCRRHSLARINLILTRLVFKVGLVGDISSQSLVASLQTAIRSQRGLLVSALCGMDEPCRSGEARCRETVATNENKTKTSLGTSWRTALTSIMRAKSEAGNGRFSSVPNPIEASRLTCRRISRHAAAGQSRVRCVGVKRCCDGYPGLHRRVSAPINFAFSCWRLNPFEANPSKFGILAMLRQTNKE